MLPLVLAAVSSSGRLVCCVCHNSLRVVAREGGVIHPELGLLVLVQAATPS
jgi:hypothetical protein